MSRAVPSRQFSASVKNSAFAHAKPFGSSLDNKGDKLTDYQSKISTAEDAIAKYINSNARIFVHTSSGAPQALIRKLGPVLGPNGLGRKDIEITHLHVNGDARYYDKEYEDTFRIKAMFFGANERKALYAGHRNIDYIPVFLHETQQLFRDGVMPLDVALISVSPPDRHGYCSLGTNVDCTLAAVQNAKVVIAQINKHVPRTHGDGFIHLNQIDALIQHDEPLVSFPPVEPTAEELTIGRFIAERIPDRACLQLGIGSIPNAICYALEGHKDLGVHTEMFSDGVLKLAKKGVITNAYKKLHAGETVTTFVSGSQELYDYCDDNPDVVFRDVSFTNDIATIQRNPRMFSCNSCAEIDLTGQICADSMNGHHYSGVGGQVDFVVGSSRSEGGKPVIAMLSSFVDKSGKRQSKIVTHLRSPSVTTSRAHVHYIATEYGIVDLHGKSLAERAKLLISIAHPELRDELTAKARTMFNSF